MGRYNGTKKRGFYPRLAPKGVGEYCANGFKAENPLWDRSTGDFIARSGGSYRLIGRGKRIYPP